MAHGRKKSKVVIEVRGGCVVSVYGNTKKLKVILADWDEYVGDGRLGAEYPVDPLTRMSEETLALSSGIKPKQIDLLPTGQP